MITVLEQNYVRDGICQFSLAGLSGDDKPTDTLRERTIANGSTFLEMDTGTLYCFDAEHTVWIAFGGEG